MRIITHMPNIHLICPDPPLLERLNADLRLLSELFTTQGISLEITPNHDPDDFPLPPDLLITTNRILAQPAWQAYIKQHPALCVILLVTTLPLPDALKNPLGWQPYRILEVPWQAENLVFTVKTALHELQQIQLQAQLVSKINRLQVEQQQIRQDQARIQLEAKEAVAMANKMKSEFLANISHEVRTPMNAILGFAEILDNTLTNPQHKQQLAAIRTSGKTLLNLFNDLLDLAKAEAGKLALYYQPLSLRDLLEELCALFTPKARNKGLTLKMVITPETPDLIILDETRLQQILIKLLSNAIKFTHQGRVKLKITAQPITVSKIDLQITVSDTGIGIPAAQTERIFIAFEQQNGQNHALYGGTGLGLAITQQLVKLMQGTIQVTSQCNQGTTFTICLPGIQVTHELGAVHPHISRAPLAIQSLQFAPATILIADDADLNRLLLRSYLQPYAFHLIEAHNGQEALDYLQQHPVDLVLMDIQMPIMSGPEAAQRIRQQLQLTQLPIIGVTASVLPEETAQWNNLFTAILDKPIDQQRLLRLLVQYLSYQEVAPLSPLSAEDTIHGFIKISATQASALLDIIERDLKPAWQHLSPHSAVNEIEAFAAQAITLARQYHYVALETWGMQLQHQALAFDMTALHQTLAELPRIEQNLQAMASPK